MKNIQSNSELAFYLTKDSKTSMAFMIVSYSYLKESMMSLFTTLVSLRITGAENASC